MTSPLGVIGVNFRGTDCQRADLRWMLEVVRGWKEPPTVRGVDQIVPGRRGRVWEAGSRIADVRTIELRGPVRGVGADGDEEEDRIDFDANAATISALFDPELDPGPLVLTFTDGSTATCQARALATQLWDQQLPSLARFGVELECVDPDWVTDGAGSGS